MRISFMQPYFLPYLGYFDLINSTDLLVFFDEAQYVKQRWMNRNRILHPQKGWQFITVPVKKAPLETSIAETRIQNAIDWKKRILNQLDHYRLRAPYFESVRELLQRCFAQEFSGLSELNIHTLRLLCEYLGIESRTELTSDLHMYSEEFNSPHDWVFDLCARKVADEYVNLPGGTLIYDRERFEQKGIALEFRNLPPMKYETPGYQFEPGLSIIDVLMWNSPQTVRDYLDAHKSAVVEVNGGAS
jgi:hypothetical protein